MKQDWKAAAKEMAEQASRIEVDMAVAPHAELVELWSEWCGWRSELAALEKLKPWTPRAARMEMRNIAVALDKHRPEVIAAQIRKAITGCWHGLNLDTLRADVRGTSSDQSFPPVC